MIVLSNRKKNLTIKERMLPCNAIKHMNFDNDGFSPLGGRIDRFGYQCIFNSKNEAVIIMIGGRRRCRKAKSAAGNMNSKMLHLLNTTTKEMYFYENVCLICIRGAKLIELPRCDFVT